MPEQQNQEPIVKIVNRWMDEFFELLRFPSISTDSRHRSDVEACAEWLSTRMQSAGLQSGIHPTPGHPVVIGRNEHEAGRPTVLVYGHYDVQPVDPLELWESDPFSPVVRDGKVWARGATDNKGQFFAHLCGIAETIEEAGKLPVNLIMLLEGEEEIGSPSLRPFLEEHRETLACDVIVVSDTGMVAPGVPTLGYGLRGITCCEFAVRGPVRDDVHGRVARRRALGGREPRLPPAILHLRVCAPARRRQSAGGASTIDSASEPPRPPA